jgi:hypothetical protein
VRPCVGDCSPELVLGATSSGEGPTRGKNGGAAALLVPSGLAVAPAAPTAEESRRMEAS